MVMCLIGQRMHYSHEEHHAAYRELKSKGLSQWNDLFPESGHWTYDTFQNRAFLERVLPDLDLPTESTPQVLEYGCGTGPAACFLASRGFEVDACDLVPDAIEIALRMAEARGVQVNFSVADVTALHDEAKAAQYDIVLDSFCLQSIVTDEDRQLLFAGVRSCLKPAGCYLISTALRPDHRRPGWSAGGFYFDEDSGIFYREPNDTHATADSIERDGRRLIPYRRHLTVEALTSELSDAGFRVLNVEAETGAANVVCALES